MARGRPVTPPGTYGEVNAAKISTGRWQANLRVRLLNGSTKQIRKNGGTKAEAVRRAKQAAMEATGVSDTDDLTTTSTITALIEHYLDHLDRAAGTLDVYRSTLRNHITPGIGQLRINEATAGRLDTFLRSLAPATAKRCRSMLSGAFGVAVRYGLVLHNPVRDTLPPKITTPEARALTMEELQTVRRAAPVVHHSPGQWPTATGGCLPQHHRCARRDGCADLRRAPTAVDGSRPRRHSANCSDPRCERWRTTPHHRATGLGSHRAAVTAEGDDAGVPVGVPTGTRNPLTKSNIERWMRQAKDGWDALPADKKTGEPDVSWVTPHTFRLSVATWLNDRVSLQAASQQLGHSDSTMTEHHYLDRTATGPAVALALNAVLECTENAQKKPRIFDNGWNVCECQPVYMQSRWTGRK
ncbi:Putative integrase [Corynebacterium glyciniphilum AJ 3170]|uniref:Putative integrase n=1 Tax=Corynebacterium glyciniphilum AJ 3170 TaxID=1404245 RepID=X5DNZ3_9CORY|nr:site-specific integrase [Corynebacterium glyciniphilum]AHW64893.1 Putative integrase [Corynebacterium glyciniphilum AJ 3170]